MARRVLAIFLAVGWAAAARAADEAVTIKVKRLAAGDVVRTDKSDESTETTTVTAGGKDQKQEDKSSNKAKFTDEVLAADGTSVKPTKVKRAYETAEAVRKGKDVELGLAGKTVLIEKGADKYAYTLDGKPVAAAAKDVLDREYNRAGMAAFEDVMMPKNAVKVGEKWQVEPAVLAKLFGEQMTIDTDKTKVSGKLVKTYDKGGVKYGVIEFTIDLAITAMKSPMGELPASDGSVMSFVVSRDGCIDGTALDDVMTGNIKADIGIKLPQAEVRVIVDGTMKSTITTVKK